LRRLVARRNQVVRHRTRIKNEVHAILHAHLILPCPHADLFGRLGRIWLAQQVMPDDECAAIERHLRELDRLSEDLGVLDTQIAQTGSADPAVKRLLTSTAVNLIVAAGVSAPVAAVRSQRSRWRASSPSCAGSSSPRAPITNGHARPWSPTNCARWSCRPGSRRERATRAELPTLTMSKRCAMRKSSLPGMPNKLTSASSATGSAAALPSSAPAPT